jgi:tetratricopeptide (TPR) repeat protein
MVVTRLFVLSLLAGSLQLALAQGKPGTSSTPVDVTAAPRQTEKTVELDEVDRLMRGGKIKEALALVDEVIASYEDRYRRGKGHVFSSRSPAEAQAYLRMIGTAPGTSTEQAGVYNSTWGDAYYLKGYMLVEQRRFEEARKALEAAVALAPRNAAYRTELGQLLLKGRAWDAAEKHFKQAEVDARELSPASVRKREITGALRGEAFVLVEKKDLDGAEKLYNECLKLDPDDRVAQAELAYIAKQRAKAK